MHARRLLSKGFATVAGKQAAGNNSQLYSVTLLKDDYLKKLQSKLQVECESSLPDFSFLNKKNIIASYLKDKGNKDLIAEEKKTFSRLLILSWLQLLYDEDELSIEVAKATVQEFKSKQYQKWGLLDKIAFVQLTCHLKLAHPSWYDAVEAEWPENLERIIMLGASHAEMYYCSSALKRFKELKVDLLSSYISKWYQIPIALQFKSNFEESLQTNEAQKPMLFGSPIKSQMNVGRVVHSVIFSESESDLDKKDFVFRLWRYLNMRLTERYSQETGGKTVLLTTPDKFHYSDLANLPDKFSRWSPLAEEIRRLLKESDSQSVPSHPTVPANPLPHGVQSN